MSATVKWRNNSITPNWKHTSGMHLALLCIPPFSFSSMGKNIYSCANTHSHLLSPLKWMAQGLQLEAEIRLNLNELLVLAQNHGGWDVTVPPIAWGLLFPKSRALHETQYYIDKLWSRMLVKIDPTKMHCCHWLQLLSITVRTKSPTAKQH